MAPNEGQTKEVPTGRVLNPFGVRSVMFTYDRSGPLRPPFWWGGPLDPRPNLICACAE